MIIVFQSLNITQNLLFYIIDIITQFIEQISLIILKCNSNYWVLLIYKNINR